MKDLEWFKKEVAPYLIDFKIEYRTFENGDFGSLDQVIFNSSKKGGGIDFWGLDWLGVDLYDYDQEEEVLCVLLEPGQEQEKELALQRLLDLLFDKNNMVVNSLFDQCSSKYYLKINNLRNIESFEIDKGKFYVCISDIHNLGKFLSGVKRSAWEKLFHFSRRKEFPTDIECTEVERTIDVFFANFKTFRHIKICKLLKMYGFDNHEIESLLKEFNFKKRDYAEDIIHVSIRAAILVDILFKKSNLILFHTAGLSYPSSMKIYKRIRQRLQQYPQKSAIVFEIADGYNEVFFQEISEQKFDDEYEVWLRNKISSFRSEESFRQEEAFKKEFKERREKIKIDKSNWKKLTLK